jgi:GntR family transcriptional regulator
MADDFSYTAPPLSKSMLDDDAAAPLYRQLYQILRARILSGAYPSGATLPGEQELSDVFGLSRITVKRALNELAGAGLVSRHRGRGTVVSYDAAVPVVKASFDNLLESLRLMGVATEVELLDVAEIAAGEEVAALLDVSLGTLTQRAVRLRKVHGAPFSYLVTHVPAEIASGFPAAELARRPLLDLLESAGWKAVEAEQWVTAVAAEAQAARALGVAPGAPLLRITRVLRDARGRGIEALAGFYRPDRFQHHVKLTRRKKADGAEWG